MNIRSITAFFDATYPLDDDNLAATGRIISACREALIGAGFTVQTTRLATQPFPGIRKNADSQLALEMAKNLESLGRANHFDYVALGPVRLDDPVQYLDIIPHLLSETENVFVCIEIANKTLGIDLERIQMTAETIRKVAHLQQDGFANLRFAALANVEPWFPYFPAAYHGGGTPRTALAIEGADLAKEAIQEAASLRDVRSRLAQTIESHAKCMELTMHQVLKDSGMVFQGIDFTLAPYPEDARSIGAALEQLGLPAFGASGSLMAAAFLTDALGRAQFARTGFCGLMLPVLEDSRLARRAGEGMLRVSDLLVCSAVCGTGLDTIPLPGDIDQDRLAAVLMDVAALALRLDKPLTARLMPLPGKQAGDRVTFDFEYFASSRVMDIEGNKLAGLLAEPENIDIQPLRQASHS